MKELEYVKMIVKAEFYAYLCWLKNNKLFAFMTLAWPYLMAAFILGLGTALGSLSVFASKVGVANPIFYIVLASGVLVSSINIVDYSAWTLLDLKWLGVLPYIMASPPGLKRVAMYGLIIPTMISSAISLTAVAPVAVIVEGPLGLVKVLIVLGLVYLATIPLIGIAVIAGSLSLIFKEESFVSFLSPLMLLVSGVYYPITFLPKILQVISYIVPVTYVVEAAKILSVFGIPPLDKLFWIAGVLVAMSILYNLIAYPGLRSVEKNVRKHGIST